MNHTEYILIDRGTGKAGRYQYAFDDEAELISMIDFDTLLTVDEMADVVLDEFTEQERNDMAALEASELVTFHQAVGQDIRKAFGLWLEGNPNVKVHPADTSMEVLELTWKLANRAGNAVVSSQVMVFK